MSILNLDLELQNKLQQKMHRQVIRLTTAAWKSRTGAIFLRKTISPLKRSSTGYQILSEDVDNIGATEVVERITNLHSVPDGVYEVVSCNQRTDWETGTIDDYDYQLIPKT